MPRIADYYNNNEIALYYQNASSNTIPSLGETLFPPKKKLGLNLSYIKSGKGVPQVLKPSSFDVKASIRDRAGFEKIESEMPYFKESFLIKESDRQEMLKILDMSKNDEYLKTVLSNLYDDATNLIDAAQHQYERMRMQLLCKGKIQVGNEESEIGVDFQYGTHFIKAKADWSDASTDIISEIEAIMDLVETRSGTRPTRALCSSKTMSILTKNTGIKNAVLGSKNNTKYVTKKMVQEYFKDEFELSIVAYSKKFTDEDGNTHGMFDDEVFTLLPPNTLGSSWFGTTPEEADLMGSAAANVSITDKGIALKTIEQADPVNVQTVVSFLGLPSFENLEQVEIILTKPGASDLDNGAEADTLE